MPILYFIKSKRLVFVKYIKTNKVFLIKVDGYFFYSFDKSWVLDYEFWKAEAEKYSLWNYKPKDGDVIIDIGAGIGEEMVVFSSLIGIHGKVYSIEADPVTYKLLEKIKNLNNCSNAYIFNLAISNNCNVVQIAHDENYLKSTLGKEGQSEFFIEGITLDDFVDKNNIGSIDLLKVNIEGAERLLIEGLNSSLSKIKNIAISCHDFRYISEGNEFFKTRELVQSFLIKNNFEVIMNNSTNLVQANYVYAINKNFNG